MIAISSSSKEYVKVPVRAEVDGTEVNFITDNVDVFLAFPETGVDPEEADWVVGAWEENSDGGFFAKTLIGPGSDTVLEEGIYDVWVRIVDAPEQPERQAGQIKIT